MSWHESADRQAYYYYSTTAGIITSVKGPDRRAVDMKRGLAVLMAGAGK